MLYFYLKMHQNTFGGRAPPGPDGGAYSAPPNPLAGLKGRGGREGKEVKEGGERGGSKGENPQCLKCIDGTLTPYAITQYAQTSKTSYGDILRHLGNLFKC